ncbi:MAG TPA: hypothetical protein VFE20_08425, partial [Thermoleophilia bacterium]|nr:hypothetical protein [Thermoleophilia bacterium]
MSGATPPTAGPRPSLGTRERVVVAGGMGRPGEKNTRQAVIRGAARTPFGPSEGFMCALSLLTQA